MFIDLFRVVAKFRLSILPATASVFRALVAVKGALAGAPEAAATG